MKLLFVAADPMEFKGVLARASTVRPLDCGLDWARSARLGENDAVLAAHGAGAKRASIAVDLAVKHVRPDAIVSIGFCGALDEGLQISQIVIATSISQEDREYGALPLIGAGACRHGKVRSIHHVAQSSAEKRRLRASGACVVEMEAAGVAERAAVLGLPFYCVRAVTDLACEDMANDFNAALRSDGHFDTISILRGAFRQPAVRLPELLRLRQRCIEAARGLGDFFADCRF